MKYYNQQELGKRIRHKVLEKASRYEDRKQEKDKSHEKKSVLEKLEEKSQNF